MVLDMMIEYKDFLMENCDFSSLKENIREEYEYYYHDFIPIPKHIYYDHFGKMPLSEKEQENIENWIGSLVEFDAKITCLNEDNCDISENPWIKKAYENGRFDFVGHYFKCKTLFEKGGIALTPRIQGKKYITPLLLQTRNLFGFFDDETINTEIYASAPKQSVFDEFLSLFKREVSFPKPDFSNILKKEFWRELTFWSDGYVKD